MNIKKLGIVFSIACMIGVACAESTPATSHIATAPSSQDASQSAVARRIGAIKSVSGNIITLTPDSGAEVVVTLQPNARIVRIAPGAKDLKDASPLQPQDLAVGDRVRVRGQAAADGGINALEVLVMARSDIDARHQQEQQDWQKRGLGGLVSSVDAAAGTVTISVTGLGGSKSVAVHASKSTTIRRYSPDSVKFDDAKVSTLGEIRAGDQLRARGDRSADGAEMTAEEIVTGRFRNIAGTVISTDATAGTINVQDLLSKKAVVVKVTTESQLHKLPPELAQRIATRLKSNLPPGMPGAGGAQRSAGSSADASGGMKPGGETANGGPPSSGGMPLAAGSPAVGGMGAGSGRAGSSDFQQILNRMPAVAVADLKKGDAVLIVATEGYIRRRHGNHAC